MAVTFTLDQKTVDTEIEKRREAKLAKLHPIFRFLREKPAPACVGEDEEAPPPRAPPSTFRTNPLTADSPQIELQLSAVGAGEAGASVTARTRVVETPERPSWLRGKLTARRALVLGAVALTGLFLW